MRLIALAVAALACVSGCGSADEDSGSQANDASSPADARSDVELFPGAAPVQASAMFHIGELIDGNIEGQGRFTNPPETLPYQGYSFPTVPFEDCTLTPGGLTDYSKTVDAGDPIQLKGPTSSGAFQKELKDPGLEYVLNGGEPSYVS